MVRTALLIAAAALAPQEWENVPPDAWITIATGPTGIEWQIRSKDYHSISQAKPYLWVQLDASHDKSVKWRRAMHRYRVNCAAETHALLNLTVYAADGHVVDSWSAPYSSSADQAAVPESIGADILKAACAEK